jgi:4-carboxymuconolactone decarboxylase
MTGIRSTIVTAIASASLGWSVAQWMHSGTIPGAFGPTFSTTVRDGLNGLLGTPAAAKEPRFRQLTMAELNDRQRPLGEAIMKISSIGITGPYNPMLRSPIFGQRMFDLLDYLRWHTSLPLRLNEFAILITGRLWRSQVEWLAHGPLAAKAGLAAEIIADLKANRRPATMQPDEVAVYDFVMELSTTHAVSDATFARARALLGEQQVVDLTAVTGTYVTIAMLIAMGEEDVPPGREQPFKPGDP